MVMTVGVIGMVAVMMTVRAVGVVAVMMAVGTVGMVVMVSVGVVMTVGGALPLLFEEGVQTDRTGVSRCDDQNHQKMGYQIGGRIRRAEYMEAPHREEAPDGKGGNKVANDPADKNDDAIGAKGGFEVEPCVLSLYANQHTEHKGQKKIQDQRHDGNVLAVFMVRVQNSHLRKKKGDYGDRHGEAEKDSQKLTEIPQLDLSLFYFDFQCRHHILSPHAPQNHTGPAAEMNTAGRFLCLLPAAEERIYPITRR